MYASDFSPPYKFTSFSHFILLTPFHHHLSLSISISKSLSSLDIATFQQWIITSTDVNPKPETNQTKSSQTRPKANYPNSLHLQMCNYYAPSKCTTSNITEIQKIITDTDLISWGYRSLAAWVEGFRVAKWLTGFLIGSLVVGDSIGGVVVGSGFQVDL